MNTITRSVSTIFKGALKAFRTFPASIGCAIAFAVVTLVRIQLDWPQQEAYNLLLNSLHWSFALGAIFSLAVITAEQSRLNRASAFLLANLLGVAAAAVTFLALYYFGGTQPAWANYTVVSSLAAARVGAVMLVSLIAFVILAGYPKDSSGFTPSFFMTHKAFFIALIYGAVIMLGASGVARAVQSLLYRDMSSKVYGYIGTLAGFLTFTIFIGYFPDFRKGADDAHREVAQKKPRFIEVLFVSIMIPIVLALTVVLLIWAGKTALGGMQASFVLLSAIAASYTIGGLWLQAMVSGHDSKLAGLYQRVYPIASLVILVFEAWAVINQLQNTGLKTTEYFFILIWIVAAAGAVLLLVVKSKAHQIIALLTCFLAVVSVMPVLGYQALPVTSQVTRLQNLLVSQNMLREGVITPATAEPEESVRVAITDATNYLAYAQDAKLPGWFDKTLAQSNVFKAKFGFEQTWAAGEGNGTTPGQYIGTYLYLPAGAVNISGYRWAVSFQNEYKNEQGSVTVSGDRGTYTIDWTAPGGWTIPSLKLSLDDRVILEQSLKDYIDALSEKYPPGQSGSTAAALEDMSLRVETQEAAVLLVFSNVEFSVDTSSDTFNYWVVLKGLYLRENP
ncbi:hypothetical protein SDC9_59862 [bioreactor metagenome]|uniref:DUF4153 domain-containing protein n=1 Tax=bioreactor metagenome TaxID=1076179 RepID=A0A644XBC5_9ZZZZ